MLIINHKEPKMIQQRPRLMHELVQDLLVKLCNKNQSHGIKNVVCS